MGSLTPTLVMAGCVTAAWAMGASAAEPPTRSTTSATAPIVALTSSPAQILPATFESIQRLSGFSADGRHYIHLESSRDTGAGVPKSVLQMVDLKTNACGRDRCLETRYGEEQSDWSIAQTELELLRRSWTLRQALRLDAPLSGQDLTIVARSRQADGTETLTLQGKGLAHPLTLRLQQKQFTTIQPDTTEKPQTAMALELEHNGRRQVIGSLQQPQDWILDYSVRAVKLSPQGDRLVVLLTATKPTFEGTLATTQVQGFELGAVQED